jgi:cation transport regulator
MPYSKINDLPKSVSHVLPIHAQEIYLSSFNHAHTEYTNKNKRQDPKEDLEVVCHKIAWNAVKHKYTKTQQGQWVSKA